MRTYQNHPPIPGRWSNLSPICPGSHTNQRAGGTCPAVPNTPGRAKRYNPYLASRRRRRR